VVQPAPARLKNWLQRKAARKADHVIAVSHYAIANWSSASASTSAASAWCRTASTTEWLEAPPPAEVRDATLAQYGLRPGYFLFVGTLQPRKNVERLLEAYLALPPAVRAERQLVIVGSAGWRCEELLRRIKAGRKGGVVWLNR
jgi:glycosyltransferase involved in cell wall biosynthesis